ncbi:MAG: zf-HC2 domain-containing protein [Phycisphaerales bacterium]|nr:MAG: zf-HC2 domain-containing protein [Phycisphaerales bacterium]
MNCDELNDHLADYLGDELPEEVRHSVDEHLARCAACRGEAMSLTATVSALRSLEPPARAPGVAGGLRASSRAAGLLAYAAVLLAGVGLGYVLRPAAPAPPGGGSSGGALALHAGGVHPGWVREWSGAAAPGGASPLVRNLAIFTRSLGTGADG